MNASSASAWSKIPWPVFAGLCFALPVAGVGLTRQFVLHGGPRVARASDELMPLMVVKDETKAPVAKQLAFDPDLAAAYERRATEAVVRSPIVSTRASLSASPITQALSPAVVDLEPQAHRLPATVAVTSILASPSGNRAVVAGKLRAVGVEFLPGWRITAIDPDEGSVVCTHESGETATLRIKRPGRQSDDTQPNDLAPMPR